MRIALGLMKRVALSASLKLNVIVVTFSGLQRPRVMYATRISIEQGGYGVRKAPYGQDIMAVAPTIYNTPEAAVNGVLQGGRAYITAVGLQNPSMPVGYRNMLLVGGDQEGGSKRDFQRAAATTIQAAVRRMHGQRAAESIRTAARTRKRTSEPASKRTSEPASKRRRASPRRAPNS